MLLIHVSAADTLLYAMVIWWHWLCNARVCFHGSGMHPLWSVSYGLWVPQHFSASVVFDNRSTVSDFVGWWPNPLLWWILTPSVSYWTSLLLRGWILLFPSVFSGPFYTNILFCWSSVIFHCVLHVSSVTGFEVICLSCLQPHLSLSYGSVIVEGTKRKPRSSHHAIWYPYPDQNIQLNGK